MNISAQPRELAEPPRTPDAPPRRRSPIVRYAFRLGSVAIAFWFIAGAIAAWRLTRRPHPPFAQPPPTIAGKLMEQHRLRTSDGEEIGAWFLPAQPGRGTVVFLHGIGGSRAAFGSLFEPLSREGYGVLAVSLRCHGDSTGGAHDVGYSARRDVIAAVDFLERRDAAGRVVICGTSFGAAAAAYASGDLGGRVDGYLFDSLYGDVRSTIWNRCDHYLPPGLDYAAYGGLRLWAPAFLPVSLDLLRPREHLGSIPEQTDVVIAVGSEDFRSPPSDARAMFQTARGHAKLVEFPGAGHSLLHIDDRAAYLRMLGELLQCGPP